MYAQEWDCWAIWQFYVEEFLIEMRKDGFTLRFLFEKLELGVKSALFLFSLLPINVDFLAANK